MADSTTQDLIVIGAGPSALSAAIYTSREDIDTTLYEKSIVGGLAATTDQVDNYPGFADGVPGLELADQLQRQAERFGARIDIGEATAIARDEASGLVKVTIDGVDRQARAVLIATGSDYHKLGVPGEAEHYGRGVHYCATCDGAFYRGKRLAAVGGGNSGVQEAIFLTRFADHIDLLVRSEIRASEVLQRELDRHVASGKITVHLHTSTDEIIGQGGRITGVRVTHDGQNQVLPVDGVFVFVGLRPNTGFLAGSNVVLDEAGFVVTDQKLMTNIPGVFASGDVRSGATMQVASAVGEGATAALNIREYLEKTD